MIFGPDLVEEAKMTVSHIQDNLRAVKSRQESYAKKRCQSKFTIWKFKANRNFGEFVRFFQTNLSPNKFGSNLKAVLLQGF
jgi:hypothetical protein